MIVNIGAGGSSGSSDQLKRIYNFSLTLETILEDSNGFYYKVLIPGITSDWYYVSDSSGVFSSWETFNGYINLYVGRKAKAVDNVEFLEVGYSNFELVQFSPAPSSKIVISTINQTSSTKFFENPGINININGTGQRSSIITDEIFSSITSCIFRYFTSGSAMKGCLYYENTLLSEFPGSWTESTFDITSYVSSFGYYTITATFVSSDTYPYRITIHKVR